jgi:hypothetical protein
MIHSMPRTVHSPAPSGRRPAGLPASPRFGKTVRPDSREPRYRLARKSPLALKEEKRLGEVMKRLWQTLAKTLMSARGGDIPKREKAIADALDRVRVQNLETEKPKPVPRNAFHKPFQARA